MEIIDSASLLFATWETEAQKNMAFDIQKFF